MPRKVNYGLYYDDDYDDYEDYDYDFDVEEGGPDTKQETTGPGLWSCPICTYDNDDSMTACDICGALRGPLVSIGKPKNDNTVEGTCKNSGVSKLAKSLFASLPQQMSKEGVLCPKQDDGFLISDSNSYKLGNVKGEFHEFHRAFSTRSHQHLTPFRFDVPSPDDVVSNGLHSSRMGSKAKVINPKTSQVSSKSEPTIQSNAESSAISSSFLRTGRQGDLAESKLSKDVATTGCSNALPKVIEVTAEINCSSIKESKPQSLSSTFNNMSLDLRSGKSDNCNTKERAKPRVPYKPEKWMLPQQAEDTLTQLNIAVVGHVDSGKSTLSGRLLHLLGRISQKEMHKYEKEAKSQGKGSFAYAFALDESSEERERGITMTVGVAYFDTKRYHAVVLDSPGHKDFVPNMITGATQADAAILVIDASVGSFEAGMDGSKGQTREHAQLIRSFGVDQVVVAVNKMDAVAYSKDRFDLIKQQLGVFLRSCGYKDSSLSWVPMSAMENQNLVAAPSDVRFKSWYNGPQLLDAIDSLQPPSREFSKPLLMPICDVIKSHTLGQVSACGKLEAGAIRSGSKVLVMPSAVVGTIRSLERDSSACTVARAGDNVAVTLQGLDTNHVIAGGVLCHPDFPVAIAKKLEMKVLILDGASPILVGSQLEFHIHHAKEPARVSRILSALDPKTGKVTKNSPRCITAKQSAVIEVDLHEPVCVLEFSSCKALGRVSLRSLGRTIAVGVVTQIIEKQQ